MVSAGVYCLPNISCIMCVMANVGILVYILVVSDEHFLVSWSIFISCKLDMRCVVLLILHVLGKLSLVQ
jgi:hypothetical protein